MFVVGIDAAPSGWSAVFRKNTEYFTQNYNTLLELVQEHHNIDVIAIDMIIGLPEIAKPGGRNTERSARKLLSPRSSVVFSAPCRSAVYAKTYQQALKYSRQSGKNAVGLSKQTYNITSKIRELDALLTTHPQLQSKTYEVHPELSFWELNTKKALSSKHSPQGRSTRINLLTRTDIPCSELIKCAKHTKDFLDACACLWSAIRIYEKQARHTPIPLERDKNGLRMQIYW